MLRSIAFPIGYLLFMIPLPAIVYYQLTFPLQLWASRLGADGLVALGIHTVREGNLLILPNCTLNVVEACSGIRSLLSLLAAVVAYGYLAEPSTWKRSVLAVASIPIAIATNGLRLVATGVLSYFFGPTVDSGVVHLALGLGFFALAFLSILLIHKILGLHSEYIRIPYGSIHDVPTSLASPRWFWWEESSRRTASDRRMPPGCKGRCVNFPPPSAFRTVRIVRSRSRWCKAIGADDYINRVYLGSSPSG